MNSEEEALLDIATLLVRRLERLSADSLWARRASGARGALLKLLEEAATGELEDGNDFFERLQQCMDWGFALLARAAKELP